MSGTREEILAMKDGREMDALVAERVMGWRLPKASEDAWAWMQRKKGSETKYESTGWYIEEDPDYYACSNLCRVWRPSTDIAMAWVVWEAVKHMNPRLSYDETCCDYSIQFTKGPDLGYVDSVAGRVRWIVADTAPLAICRAALLATL